MNWATKIFAKLLLARLPVPYSWWKRLGLFQHGRMEHSDYAQKIFNLHTSSAYPSGLPGTAHVLELGPGDSVSSAVIAAAHGCAATWLIDVGNFAQKDLSSYQQLALHLKDDGLPAPDLDDVTSIDEVLECCRAKYLTGGLDSLKQVPTGTIDFVWSHSVLEHVRKHDLNETLCELLRVMKPGACASHNVDYQDHLSGALNNLRFSEFWWESSFFADSGFYTNRVPAVALHKMFRATGYEVLKEEFGRWDDLPTPRSSLSDEFLCYRDEELIIRTSHLLVRCIS